MPNWIGIALIAAGAVLVAYNERDQAVADRIVTSSPSMLNAMLMFAARATMPA